VKKRVPLNGVKRERKEAQSLIPRKQSEMDAASLKSVFNKKYTEFCTELEGACPELKAKTLLLPLLLVVKLAGSDFLMK
jgi:hypothetical protein